MPAKASGKNAKPSSNESASSVRRSGPFSKAERAAMRDAVKEYQSAARGGETSGEAPVLAKIAEMTASDRAIAEGLHALIKASAPSLTPRTWYGMPAYCKDGNVLIHFQPAAKFGTRYATIGFSDESVLDEGRMWPVGYALTAWTSAEASAVRALLVKALGPSAR